MLMKKTLYIFGCGGHARSIINSLKSDCCIVLVDPNCEEGEKILGCETLKNDIFFNSLDNKEFNFIVGIGDNAQRKKMYERALAVGGKPINVCAKSAVKGLDYSIAEGIFLAEKAYLGPQASVGCDSIINTGAVIEHETRIGEHAHIAPGATVCGRCSIGNNVFLGAGSTVIDKTNIVDDVIIGAGSVVIKDILEKGTYVGCPARKIHD